MLSKALTTAAAGSAGGDYQIERSLRFNSADSAYLSRTPASAGNQKTWTISFWVKKTEAVVSTYRLLWDHGNSSASDRMYFNTDPTNNDVLSFYLYNVTSGYLTSVFRTSAKYRDPSAWMHICISVDTTQAVDTDRARCWINGVTPEYAQYTAPAQNSNCQTNSTSEHNIGRWTGNAYYLNGYIADYHLIDGQALDCSSFGEVDSVTGVWKPIAYSGSYGTNGFHLDFSDNSNTTATTLGKDSSGNGNNWTPSGSPGFSVAAGAGNDSLVDSPTQSGTDTGSGGEVIGNYATLNVLDNQLTLSNGNLQFDRATTSWASSRSTVGITSGKWYWEVTPTANSGTMYCMAGIALNSATLANYFATSATGWAYSAHDGGKYNNATYTAYGSTWTTNDVIGIAFDADAGTLTFYKNNVSQGTAYTGLTSGPYIPAVSLYGTQTAVVNFGQRPFAYTAPSGFKALCTTNLPDPTVVQGDDHFNTVLYTGNNQTPQSITGVGFQPDWVWIKSRSYADQHILTDAVRGTSSQLSTSQTAAETTRTDQVTSFDSDGFSLGVDAPQWVNYQTQSYVAWNWKANGAGGTSHTQGTISSTASVNTTAGFSIVTWTGAGSTGTVGHGLGVAPKLIITKNRTDSATVWYTYTTAIDGSLDRLQLESTAAKVDVALNLPTSTVFSAGATTEAVSGKNYVAYCFAPIIGFSAMGAYTGNGSADGSFVFTGFKPAFVMIKRSSSTGNWYMFDSARRTYNYIGPYLIAQSSGAEDSLGSFELLDFVSNGFKLRNSGADINGSGSTLIYAAFAENPFKNALAR